MFATLSNAMDFAGTMFVSAAMIGALLVFWHAHRKAYAFRKSLRAY